MQTYFFLGIGGIGMSALARYFHQQNTSGDGAHIRVMGYDRTPSALTRELEQEGIEIIYGDDQLEIGDWRLKICRFDLAGRDIRPSAEHIFLIKEQIALGLSIADHQLGEACLLISVYQRRDVNIGKNINIACENGFIAA